MSLTQYNKKRRFDETTEPVGKEKSSPGSLRFVVQKHDASHLHYDFRLEMAGVLKSWAVPKGPSLNPADKRLAMMVEDHPLDYRNFEGIIPEGNYGGGTVIVWDEGTYEPIGEEGSPRKVQEKDLLAQLHKGTIKIVLHGKKLKGEFTLFLMKARGERSWILAKKKDEAATTEPVTEQDRSVKTGKTIAEVAAENGTVPNHPKASSTPSKRSSAKAARTLTKKAKAPAKVATKAASKAGTPKGTKKKLPELVQLASEKGLRKRSMPQSFTPMLATLTDEPFDNPEWLYEIKWDGYRTVAHCSGDNVELISRNGKAFTEKYGPVRDALAELGIEAVLDGEIVAVEENGLANFQLLQNWQNTPVRLQFFIFDIVWLQGYDITRLPLIERKQLLCSLIPEDHEILKYSDHVKEKGKDFFDVAVSKGLEGMMAKRATSTYLEGERSEDWLKVKVNLRQEVVIAGYTEPRRTRTFFGSLLLGVYDGDELVYVGHTGSGFNKKSLEEIYNKLQPIVTESSPFVKKPKTNMPATWVKPKLVCEIKFTEWTKDRMARHPIFMGLRSDKKPKDVVFEKSKHMAKLNRTPGKTAAKTKTAGRAPAKKATTKKAAAKKTGAAKKAAPKKASKAKPAGTKAKLLPAMAPFTGADQQLIIEGKELTITSLDKLYWKKEKFTKGAMISYYRRIAPFILPYMLDRPMSLNRHPNGIGMPNFFQKDMGGKGPSWITTHDDFSESTNTTVSYLVCTGEASLIYMANLGCIEMNPWHSRVDSWQQPDWCLIDLDPDKGNSFDQVIDTALVVKKVLDAIGASCCVKTSGSSGIHIMIPLGAKYNYDQSKQLAELVVNLVQSELPELTSVERNPAKRKGKIYLDFLQNRETQTAAAPYCLRPKPGVPVSTPLDWTELKKGMRPTDFTAFNIFDRLKDTGDLFRPVLGKGIDLEKVLRKLEPLISK